MTTPQEDFPLTPPTHHEIPSVELVSEEWGERLQIEIMEDYLFLAEMKKHAKDPVAHIERMREQWDKLKSFIKSEKEKTRQEVLREVREKIGWLTRYCRSKFLLHKTDCCGYYEGVENEPVVDMLLEKEVLDILSTPKNKE